MSNKLVLKPRHLRGEDGSRIISVRMKENLIRQLEEIAGRTGYSRNQLFSILLDFAVKNCEIKDK